MNSNNLISTPDITGNIGSCSTQTVVVAAERTSVWKVKDTAIATNSCTGQLAIHWCL
jgi:hypothetical protein